MKKPEPAVIRVGLCHCQVCVPKDWTDEQINEFVNNETPTGIKSNWAIPDNTWWLAHRSDDSELRTQCSDYPDHIHTVLIC